ncbi:acetyl-CoA carboxylase carboxyltransferase subunit alpha [Deinococcus metallilatus]|uniref:Acetyl-coenzyme A carboxylase carboxyl transferase subunit alpha n=1 Tax=Deinococcus metallilatus TaxID=1211322 RepID=A0AAJ5F3C2_9DEIO|nr:acetyl-CoA carboxylase carboxyltransferase subunit alpha [Deinococcus metallilatus]MBB5296424.1 acetyl-CoA carboxylase carboxyl transferase subunit alpha [Deinococcus metallilatus]QBY09906.1 acetyl-CoA carboxylase carboxyltransferase subunit alpha [Deinococcus metallilatus]RXJ08630.1 acetyl-CoA carboxylase carboxyltransferase subunit alpha [Deinococcus metallilatus]TLK25104.1 acetyl-CoA carboxylase carboxyltransferase subunit alpha [Deinococcus metallilatus]GMA14663.1 acetyl-coenzyme A carb
MTTDTLSKLEERVRDLEATARETGQNLDAALTPLKAEVERLRAERSANLSRWDRVQLARTAGRPTALDYVERLCTDFTELHGDRAYGDDPALIGGPARWQGTPVMLLLQQKGRDTKSKIKRRFGSANPEGYRKAVRLMDLADRFGLPVVALIDTQGAYPGIEAEERGQGWAIAESIQRMVRLRVPAVCAVIGEGGSGGALAIGVGNRVLIQENAWYSVISPEGAASIIWKDAGKAPEAAEALKLTAPDLLDLGIVEEVIPEPVGGAHLDVDAAARALGEAVSRNLADLAGLDGDELRAQRAERFRGLGAYSEV